MKKAEKKDKGRKHQTLKAKIVILLQERNDLTRNKLIDILQKSEGTVNMALTSLRKVGYRIWPSKGPGTPLKIANSQLDAAKFINWRRGRFLGTAKRMIVAEFELGQEYRELAESPKNLLLALNKAKNEISDSSDK